MEDIGEIQRSVFCLGAKGSGWRRIWRKGPGVFGLGGEVPGVAGLYMHTP